MTLRDPRHEDQLLYDLDTFEKLYLDYYSILCLVAQSILHNKELSEEIVGDTFCHLWENRRQIDIKKSTKFYLVKSVKNRCINYLEHLKAENKLLQNLKNDPSIHYHIPWSDNYPLGNLLDKELTALIEESISALPDQCRNIFLLSRNEELKYEEIASRLNISVNTVKTQMKIALTKLKEKLKDYLPVILFVVYQFIGNK